MTPTPPLVEPTMDVQDFDRRPIRIAYFLTSRELAQEEPIADPGDAAGSRLNETHRGNLPRFQAMVRRGLLPRAELALIAMNDDVPYRDFSDLGVPVFVQPFPQFASDAPKGSPERNAEIAAYRAAKEVYERRLVDILRGHGIDIIVCDRYMIIHGPVLLDAFLGLMVNTHPAILPDLPGATPTADALRRARDEGIWFTGNTLHIMDDYIDTGPPIWQVEATPIYPSDSHWDLRRRNYEHEPINMLQGLREYLEDPQVQRLIGIHRALRAMENGVCAELIEARRNARQNLLGWYRQLFTQRQDREEIQRTARGEYIYSAADEERNQLPWPRPFQRLCPPYPSIRFPVRARR